jgi:flagellar biosynthesis protein FlhB
MSDEQQQDKSQKTEQPTLKRLEDAAKKGQVVTSREVNHFFILLSLAFILLLMGPSMMSDVKMLLAPFLGMAEDVAIDEASFVQKMRELMSSLLVTMLLPIVTVLAAIIAANLVQNRFVWSLEPVKPKLEKISVLKGIGRLFSRRNFVEFLKGILKITIVGIIVVLAVYPFKEHLRLLPNQDLFDTLGFISAIALRIFIGVLLVMFLIAILDFVYQKFEFIEQLKMTRQEVKDEYKQQEGDPLIKQKLRQIRRERANQQMMAAVPDADVVITNPTHYAVALKYDSGSMNAPLLVAKGKDKVALRIREIADQNKVIVMRNPPLTRLLYDNVEIDAHIPTDYYKAVAEIIGYVYKLRGIELKR